jgi:Flp pilus assembly protein TadD
VLDHVAGLPAALDRLEAGEPTRTEAICRELLNAEPGDQAVTLLLGLAIGAQGDFERAQPVLIRVANQGLGSIHRRALAGILIRARCRGFVAALFRECLRRAPDDPKLRYCFAEILQETHALDEAREVLTEGLRQHPNWPAAHLLLGMVFADAGQFGAAAGQFRRVTTLVPDEAAGWANLGVMLKIESRFDAALKAHDRAVALAPRDARIRVNRAVALLHAGRLREAWPEFEWRLALPEHQGIGVQHLMPPLSQLGSIAGRTILVTHEDGFGDTLQFMRYLPLLAERRARVLAWVPGPLVRIMQTVAGVAEVLTGDIALPSFDYHCPFVSLPRVFESSLDTIPHHIPYLSADVAAARRWAERVPDEGLRVGLVWAGQVRPHLPGFDVVDARRSTQLVTLAPLAAVQGVRFINLQAGYAAEQARHPPEGLELFDPMADVTDFADTAAIVANLDAVVTVDTSVAHLAGAMGKPVLLLDRYDNCWRWLSGRMDSPWYPSLRIFRQKRLYDWAPVVQRVAAALKAMVAARGHPCPAPQCRDAA